MLVMLALIQKFPKIGKFLTKIFIIDARLRDHIHQFKRGEKIYNSEK